MNRDFAEMLSRLIAAGAEFLIVGAYAVAAHGIPRATGDLDLWVRPTPENAQRVWKALVEFGAPLHDLSLEDLSIPGTVFQIGLPPSRIDLLTELTGMTFDIAWQRRANLEIEGIALPLISREDLIRNKSAVGRPQDLADVQRLLQK